jgi:Ser/Thr protein kinase RdoA (MazF antagonist)
MLLDALAEPFEPVSEPAARAALAEHWGIRSAELQRLDTERDDTFRAGDVLLKIAHPKDDPALVEMQSAAMRHVAQADPGIPIQRIVPTLQGDYSVDVVGRIARVITWFDGELVDDSPQSPALFEDAGRMLGRLNRALADFDHPGAHRSLAWDLPRLPELRADATEPLHLEVIDRFAQDVSPALARLPHQVIHNDAHPGNLLVSADAPDRLAGILDWGDSVYSARVCDLAVALAYLVPDAPRPWPDVEAFTAGFESVVPLLDEERVLLPMLLAARTIMRSVVNQALHRDQHTDPYGFYARNDRKLVMILED